MAHYAKFSENNEILGVHTLDNKNEQNESGETVEALGQAYLEQHSNWPANLWKKCSYNTNSTPTGSVHTLGGTPYRGVYPSKGMEWNEANQVFRHKQPYTSWSFNTTSLKWDPPIAPPETTTNIGGRDMPDFYDWDEALYQSDNTKGWVKDDNAEYPAV